jgi:putative sterol carrier protein
MVSPHILYLAHRMGQDETKDSVSGMLMNVDAVTLLLSDDDFGKLVRGTAKAQSLFMAGKLKIRGDIMKATRLEPILGKAQTKAKL